VFRLYRAAGFALAVGLMVSLAASSAQQPPQEKKGEGKKGGFGGGFGGFGRPGQIMSTFIQDQLKLSDDQKKQVADLQKETEDKIDKILTEEQRKQYKEIRERGPGGGFGKGGFGKGGPGGKGKEKDGNPPKKDD
jgi:Spy/CpxP family protein refolding chaperone